MDEKRITELVAAEIQKQVVTEVKKQKEKADWEDSKALLCSICAIPIFIVLFVMFIEWVGCHLPDNDC